MQSILDIVFPKTCSICSRKGSYLCERCKKLFKRTLPECYGCRRLSSDYTTHGKYKELKRISALDHVFVCWEYNSLTADLLKRYKYNYVYDLAGTLSEFFIENISNSSFLSVLEGSILTNVPISSNRLRERGFNQTLEVSKTLANRLNIPFSEDILKRRNSYGHQSLKDRDERKALSYKDFVVNSNFNISSYKSITVIDDVITTGSTLESICFCLKKFWGEDLIVNAACMFRGRAYYLKQTNQ